MTSHRTLSAFARIPAAKWAVFYAHTVPWIGYMPPFLHELAARYVAWRVDRTMRRIRAELASVARVEAKLKEVNP